jgi:hypothetical protein
MTQEQRNADVLRSIQLVANVWEEDLPTVDEMTAQLEALIEVVTGKSDFATLTESTNLTSRVRLN